MNYLSQSLTPSEVEQYISQDSHFASVFATFVYFKWQAKIIQHQQLQEQYEELLEHYLNLQEAYNSLLVCQLVAE